MQTIYAVTSNRKKTQATAESYACEVRLYIQPYLGNIPYAKLSLPDVEIMINSLLEKGLSERTVNGARKTLKQVIDFVMERDRVMGNNGLIYNPADLKTIKNSIRDFFKKNKATRQLDALGNVVNASATKAFTEEEARRFIRCAFGNGHRLSLGFLLCLTCGLRPGEMLGIKKENVHLQTRTINILNDIATLGDSINLDTMKPKNIKAREDNVKSFNSARPIFISDTMVKLLEHHIQMIDAEQERRGGYDEGFLFPTKDGKPINNRNARNTFESIARNAEIIGKSTHCLRHTFRTFLSKWGVSDMEAACLMGHSTNYNVTSSYNWRTNSEIRESFEKQAQPHFEETFHKLAFEEIMKRDPDRTKPYI